MLSSETRALQQSGLAFIAATNTELLMNTIKSHEVSTQVSWVF
jgi:hypothetical protein